MASLRIFARSKLSSILHAYHKTEPQKIVPPITIEIQKRWSNYSSSHVYKDPSKYTDFDISPEPKEWQYVERLFPYKTVPVPPLTTEKTLTNWKSPSESNKNMPYFVPRTKNHMQPVYLRIDKRGMRKLTYVRKIQGDIWKFESELKAHLQKSRNYVLSTRISELAGVVSFRGDCVSDVRRWLDSKGF